MKSGATRPPAASLMCAVVAVIILAALLVVLTGCVADRPGPGAAADYTSTDGTVTQFALGNRAEPINFEGSTETGETLESKDFRGQVLVVNFWYAACPPCRTEAPWLRDLSDAHAQNEVKFLGVNVRDTAATSTTFTEEYGITYPSLVDSDQSVMLAFSGVSPLSAVPSTLVFDREGRLAGRIVGIIDKDTLDDMIVEVRDEQSS